MPLNIEVLRSELMKFSKEELVTELLGALLELARSAEARDARRALAPAERPGIEKIEGSQ